MHIKYSLYALELGVMPMHLFAMVSTTVILLMVWVFVANQTNIYSSVIDAIRITLEVYR